MAETVSIGCKMPNGLILRIMRADQTEHRIELKGANKARVIGGFGVTEGVSKDAWDKWHSEHKTFPAVKNGLIFALPNPIDVEREAEKNRAGIKSGFEPVVPDAPGNGVATLER